MIIKLVIVLVIGLFLFLTGVFFYIFYESKIDVSENPKFSKYLEKPIEIKSKSTLRWNKNKLRFCNYSLQANEDSNFDLEDIKSVKRYKIGDFIVFNKALKFSNMHVGDTYYLIGNDTLPNGAIIEFEYYTNSQYSSEIWETEALFLKRIKNN